MSWVKDYGLCPRACVACDLHRGFDANNCRLLFLAFALDTRLGQKCGPDIVGRTGRAILSVVIAAEADLAGERSPSFRKIAKAVGLDVGSVRYKVRKLERLGFLRVMRCPDRCTVYALREPSFASIMGAEYEALGAEPWPNQPRKCGVREARRRRRRQRAGGGANSDLDEARKSQMRFFVKDGEEYPS